LPQTFDGASVTLAGGAGTLLTFKADTAYNANFARARPYTATTTKGRRLSLGVTGSASGTFAASDGQLFIQDSRTTLVVTLRVDGAVSSSLRPSSSSSAQYTCSPGRKLTLSSGGFPTNYAPAG
jgi:hypothetical protein